MSTNPPQSQEQLQLIAVITSRITRYIKQTEIVFLEANGCYTKIHLNDASSMLVSRTLKNYEVELNKQMFLRCHRSFIVNRSYIKLMLKTKYECLVLDSGIKIPIARRKMFEVKRVMSPVSY